MEQSIRSLPTIRDRQRALLAWYARHGRHALPWRLTRDPYGILVSEVMLQQTQVDRVIPYWTTWLRRWPTVETLARARRASVIRAWAGLGYNRRAVYLHQLAQEIVRHGWPTECSWMMHGARRNTWETPKSTIVEIGVFPEERHIMRYAQALQQLPGIGPYTANALLAFAWNLPVPCVDTNVRRVLAYVILRRPSLMRMSLPRVMALAAPVIPRGKGRIWHYALMDYGALVLTARHPNVQSRALDKRRRVQPERFAGSSRFWRGRIVAVLRELRGALPLAVLRKRLMAFGDPPDDLERLVNALVRDGVIRASLRGYRLA
ncbi:A/G-specific adenine glycosylase [Candidatus Uhrbacteria bacterium]|nr:A/G-specific adenine glycosylase [Candidatus Uhrbacteria bacterium]